METIKVACVQMNCAMGDRETNLAKIVQVSEKAAADGVKIVCFPELSITGSLYEGAYPHSETIPGPSSDTLLPVAREHDITIIAGTCERGQDGVIYNSLLLVFPDGRIERFRKLYIPEGEYPFFRQGADVPVFQMMGCTFGVSICADLNFAELYMLMAVKGADVIFNANGSGRGVKGDELLTLPDEDEFIEECRVRWPRFLQFFSEASATYFLMCNQVGYSHHTELRGKFFPGVSLASDPTGKIITASEDGRQEEILMVQLDPTLLAEQRQKRAFALRKRRRDILEELAWLS